MPKNKCNLWGTASGYALLLALAGCGGGGGGGGGGGSAGGSAESGGDSGHGLADSSTGGGEAPPAPDTGADAHVGPGDMAAPPADGPRTDASTPPADGGQEPDAAPPPAVCDGHEVIDLNAWLADHEAYEGTTAGAPAGLTGTCGGIAGGEVVFKYTVAHPLDRLIVRTDFPETTSPTVVYARRACDSGEDLACNRGSDAAPGTRSIVDNPPVGDLFIVVDQSARDGGGPFKLAVETNGAAACRDLDDNDGDGAIDLDDPGCENADDETEIDPPTPPACHDGLDNDNNGVTDYPADPECEAAGDLREGPLCALDIPSTDVDQGGGLFPTALPIGGVDAAQAGCWFEQGASEHVFIVTLTTESNIVVRNNTTGNGNNFTALWARTQCDAIGAEIGCGDPGRGDLQLPRLAPGTYFVFAEFSNQFYGEYPPPGTVAEIEFTITPTHRACDDGMDNDGDDLTDLLDPGCTGPRDNDETDPALFPLCANGQDDDGDGLIDFPADDGCLAAGTECEQVGFALCGGACIDVQADAQNCGRCGRVCADGVECIGGSCGGLLEFEGYVNDLPVDELAGWEQCFVDGYGSNTPIAEMVDNCGGDRLLMACRAAGSDTLMLAAMGDTDEVLTNVGDAPDAVHEHNGVNWYFSEQSSVGFVPAGAVPQRNSCDVLALPEWGSADDGTGSGRMCWHSSGGNFNSGFRCGLSVSYDNSLERVVYTARSAPPPMPCSDMVDQDGNGLQDTLDPGCRSPWDAVEAPVDAPAACNNGIDDDEDGAADFPADPDCRAAGDETETPRCQAPADVIEVGQMGGRFDLAAVPGDEGLAGSCGNGTMRAQIYALTLTDPAQVTVDVHTADGAVVGTTIYARTTCDDGATEIDCQPRGDRAPFVLSYVDRGTIYVVVEQSGHRTPWVVNISTVSLLRECNDLVDNDGDGAIDLADRGCERGMDGTEGGEPDGGIECSDGVDNDADGLIDWPADRDCLAAGDLSEHLICEPPYELTDIPEAGGDLPVRYDFNQQGVYGGTCGDGPAQERVFVLHLVDPSRVSISQFVGPAFGNTIYGTFYVRRACDDAGSELGCGGDQFRGQPLTLQRLEPGDYFVFTEASFNWAPDDPNIQPSLHVVITSLLQACENGRDDDGDGVVDLADLGCSRPSDNDETDQVGPGAPQPYCANGMDDDGDGNIDWPADDGCEAAGDACEEVGYLQCDGVCLDGSVDAQNCGACGNVCADGVECIDGFCGGLFYQPGIQQNVAQADLGGWHVCSQDGFGDFTDIGGIIAACGGQYVALGCRRAGADAYTLLAMGEHDQVFLDTGDQNNVVHEHNGVNWYFSQNWSIGFVPVGEEPIRNSCDVGDGQGELRMCWHTGGNQLNPGYRCGIDTPGDNTWERVVLTSN